MNINDKLEAAYKEHPEWGRYKLMQATGASEGKTQRFLERKRSQGKNICSDTENKLEGLTQHEINLIAKGLKVPPPAPAIPFTWAKGSFKFAAIADSHWGHDKSHKRWWDLTCQHIERQKCDFTFHAGDITEGMSGRDGHVYELEAIGATAQLELASHRINQLQCETQGITGNHDLWGYKTLGFDPGVELAKRCDNFTYLGQNEAVVDVGGITIMLSHPGDGSAYAISYALQQFINALSGGEKPHILLMGHHHKAVFLPYRNIQAFECGTLCAQTGWMRGKKLQAHTGFWIVEVWPNDAGIERIRQEWVPFFP